MKSRKLVLFQRKSVDKETISDFGMEVYESGEKYLKTILPDKDRTCPSKDAKGLAHLVFNEGISPDSAVYIKPTDIITTIIPRVIKENNYIDFQVEPKDMIEFLEEYKKLEELRDSKL